MNTITSTTRFDGRRILHNADGRRVASIEQLPDGSRKYERFRAVWERDYIRKFGGFALDADHLRLLADADTVRIAFADGRELTTTAGQFRAHGTPFSFGRGRQVALASKWWRAEADTVPAQLAKERIRQCAS